MVIGFSLLMNMLVVDYDEMLRFGFYGGNVNLVLMVIDKNYF